MWTLSDPHRVLPPPRRLTLEAWLGFFLLASYSRPGTLPTPRPRSGLRICVFSCVSVTSFFFQFSQGAAWSLSLSLLWLHPAFGSTRIPSIVCTYRDPHRGRWLWTAGFLACNSELLVDFPRALFSLTSATVVPRGESLLWWSFPL